MLWSTNAAEHWPLLGARGWPAERIAGFLVDAWSRLLLDPLTPTA